MSPLYLQHTLRRSILTGYSQFISGIEIAAESSYVGNDDVNTFYGDVIVAYPDLDVGNGIAQSVYSHITTSHTMVQISHNHISHNGTNLTLQYKPHLTIFHTMVQISHCGTNLTLPYFTQWYKSRLNISHTNISHTMVQISHSCKVKLHSYYICIARM